MLKIKMIPQLVFGFLLVSLLGCDSLKELLDQDFSESVELPNSFSTDGIESEIGAFSPELKAKLMNNLASDPELNLTDYYNQTYIDSLRAILIDKGSLKLKPIESFLVKHLRSKSPKDTLFMTNMFLSSPSNGEVKSFEFEVFKDDVIYYEITNTKSNTLKELSIFEGDKIRVLKNNLKKKETIKGQLYIAMDNVLTLNVSNDNFIKNKGILKSKLKITLKKTAPDLNLNVEIKQDTIIQSRPFVEVVNDTVYKLIENKKFNLGPRLDLTKNHQQTFDINIDDFESLIGWGYWIGLDKKSIDTYNELSATESALIGFSKNELKKTLNAIELPVNENQDVRLLIKNQSLDARSYNYASNFAFYKSDEFTEKMTKKAEVHMTNNSTLYAYDVSYNVIAVGATKIKNEIMKDFIAYKDFIYLTIIEDE